MSSKKEKQMAMAEVRTLRTYGSKKRYYKKKRQAKRERVRVVKEFRKQYGKVKTRLRARYIRAKNRLIRKKRKCRTMSKKYSKRIIKLSNKAFAPKGPRKTRKDKGKKRPRQVELLPSLSSL